MKAYRETLKEVSISNILRQIRVLKGLAKEKKSLEQWV